MLHTIASVFLIALCFLYAANVLSMFYLRYKSAKIIAAAANLISHQTYRREFLAQQKNPWTWTRIVAQAISAACFTLSVGVVLS